MIELHTLGGLKLHDPSDGREHRTILAQPKRIALLTYLTLASPRGFHRRDTLLGLFWPETTDARGRHALSQALYVLRRELGADLVRTLGEDEVTISPEQLWCDVLLFEDALHHGDRETALDVYRGDFLPGFFISDAPELERWIEGERARLHAAALEAARDLARSAAAAGNMIAAARWARRACALAPLDEASHRALLTVMARGGDRSGALHEYAVFERRLQAELEITPSTELQALVRDIRDEQVAPERAQNSVATFTGPQFARPRRPLVLLATFVAILVLAGATVLSRNGWRSSAAPQSQRVLVGRFANETGDSALGRLGRLASDWLADGIARTGLIRVVPTEFALQQHRASRPRSALASVAEKTLARETAATLIISGSYYSQGDTLVFHAGILDAATGELIRSVGEVSGPAHAPLRAVEALRQRVLGTLATVTDQRLSRWASVASQPPSYEAYQLFADGLDHYFRNSWDEYGEAALLFHEAAAQDSAFTLPLLWALYAYERRGEFGRADSLARSLEPRRHLLAPWDRYMLDSHLAGLRGDAIASYQAGLRLVEVAPTPEWRLDLAAAASSANCLDDALTITLNLDPEIEIRPWALDYWRMRMDLRHRLGDYQGELSDVALAGRQLPEGSRDLLLPLIRSLAALGRLRDLAGTLDRVAVLPRREAHILFLNLFLWGPTPRFDGPPAADQLILQRALAFYKEWPPEHRGEMPYLFGSLYAAYQAEQWDQVDTIVGRLQRVLPSDIGVPENLTVPGFRGALAARRGDRVTALRLSHVLAGMRQPYGYGYETAWRARIAALLRDSTGAVQLLRDASALGYPIGEVRHLARIDFQEMWTYPPFQELIRPKRCPQMTR